MPKRFGSKKEKRGKKKWSQKAKDKRKEKQMHFNYEKLASDDEVKEHEDLMKFGTFLLGFNVFR